MLNRMKIVLAVAAFAATCALPGHAVAQKQMTFKPLDTAAAREIEVKQLLLLVDTDKDGAISKQDWLKLMDAEFDRIDRNRAGVLKVNAIPQPQQPVKYRPIPGSALLGK
jgi:hypothetical protein